MASPPSEAPEPSSQASVPPAAASPPQAGAKGEHVWLGRTLDAHAGDPGRVPYSTAVHPAQGKQALHRQPLVVNLPAVAAHHTGAHYLLDNH